MRRFTESCVVVLGAIAVLVCFVRPQSPSGALSSGTVLVFGVESDRIVIAADSRSEVEGRLHSDNDCKIVALSSKLLIATSGISQYVPNDSSTKPWSAVGLARQIVRSTSDAHPRDFAEAWAARLRDQLYATFPLTAETLHSWPGDALFSGLVGGVSPSGGPELFQVAVRFDNTDLRKKPWTSIEEMTPARCRPFCAIGRYEIASEMQQGLTPRARIESETTRKQLQLLRPEKRLEAMAIRLVDLTILYGPDKNQVGGPVDAAEITRAGVRWVQCKSICK
jgi:hypothetical protein